MEYKKNMRLIILSKVNNSEIFNLFYDLFSDVTIIQKENYNIIFYVDNFFDNIKDIIDTMMIDFGEVINIHEAFILNKHIEDDFVNQYIDLVIKYNLLKESYTSFNDFINLINNRDVYAMFEEYNKQILNYVINKSNNRLVLLKYFDNNLNVLKTSKDLFINRNSLLLKFESISKAIGFNIQQFKTAKVISILMNMDK